MDRFLSSLKKSLEANSSGLKQGAAFLPSGLKKGYFTKKALPHVAKDAARRLRLPCQGEVRNSFTTDLGMWLPYQRVDYVIGNPDSPKYFLEVESLDRSQLYLFLPHGGRNDESKLWYYWATACKLNRGIKSMPRYFVWLLILPDQPVGPYQNWDFEKPHRLFDRKLKPIIQENPFALYDPLIKTSARLFLKRQELLVDRDGKWIKGCLADFQDRCELIFITCTGRQLVMSRGRDLFDGTKELRMSLEWK